MWQWFKSLKVRFILSIMESRLYAWVMDKIPFIRFSFYYTSVHGDKYKAGYKLLKPGDIILSRDNWKLTSFLIPGDLVHAALCVSKATEDFEIAEMTRVGYRKSEFYDVCHEADRIVILRCDDWDDDYVPKVIETCLSYEGLDYDIKFELGVKSLYCSELIVASDPEKRLIVSYDDLVGLGRLYLSPMGIYNADNIKVIWDSDDI